MVAPTRIAIRGESVNKIEKQEVNLQLQKNNNTPHPAENKATFTVKYINRLAPPTLGKPARACTSVLSLPACVPRLSYPAKAHWSIYGC